MVSLETKGKQHERDDMTKFFALYQKLHDISEPTNLREEINLVCYLNLMDRDPNYVNIYRLDMYLKESETHTTKRASNPAKLLIEPHIVY